MLFSNCIPDCKVCGRLRGAWAPEHAIAAPACEFQDCTSGFQTTNRQLYKCIPNKNEFIAVHDVAKKANSILSDPENGPLPLPLPGKVWPLPLPLPLPLSGKVIIQLPTKQHDCDSCMGSGSHRGKSQRDMRTAALTFICTRLVEISMFKPNMCGWTMGLGYHTNHCLSIAKSIPSAAKHTIPDLVVHKPWKNNEPVNMKH